MQERDSFGQRYALRTGGTRGQGAARFAISTRTRRIVVVALLQMHMQSQTGFAIANGINWPDSDDSTMPYHQLIIGLVLASEPSSL